MAWPVRQEFATGKKTVDGPGVRPIVERVKDRSAEFLCFGAQWLLKSKDLARTATKTRVVPNGTRDERRGRACCKGRRDPRLDQQHRKQSALKIHWNLLFGVLTVSHVNETIAATR